jgi:hypothetical protein
MGVDFEERVDYRRLHRSARPHQDGAGKSVDVSAYAALITRSSLTACVQEMNMELASRCAECYRIDRPRISAGLHRAVI